MVCRFSATGTDKAAKDAVRAIFGSDGLSSCSDLLSYENSLREVEQSILSLLSSPLRDYIVNKVYAGTSCKIKVLSVMSKPLSYVLLDSTYHPCVCVCY